MLRQLLISLVLLVLAGTAYVFFVPGSAETLARLGIPLPMLETAEAATPQAGPGGSPGAGRGGGGGGRGGFGGGGRELIVSVSPAGTATINDRLIAIGEGSSSRSVTVVSSAGGTLVDLAVRPGATVEAGDVIGQLNSESETIAVERARLAFADADAALTRTAELARTNSASTVQLNTAQLAADNARLALQEAELALERRAITTPIGGTVGLFQVRPGNYLTAQSPVTTVEDNAEILVDFWVPERYASAIRPGMAVGATAVALSGRHFEGEISAVDNRIDAASRTLQVQAALPNEDGLLRPGMSFSVELTFPGETFPTVNPLAILWSAEGSYVWKYEEGTARRIMAEIVQRNSDGVLVRGDIEAGDAIITEGILQLSDGAPVRLLDGEPPVAAARAPASPTTPTVAEAEPVRVAPASAAIAPPAEPEPTEAAPATDDPAATADDPDAAPETAAPATPPLPLPPPNRSAPSGAEG
ncbi:efflux RND transporter periplasmic adaptor subunit [Arsenicitalea aurantiaca]|uniref:efflux RND transporter periplasmic adaptor subunit n=1 Tax=Arsenicitalea aurantiaca TaxID=1783274 RepID=UPI0013151DB2|nr:efflux RND transporter periplasmic adaptor subunit [Arsenicitalea aurantiaca]